MLQTYRRDPRPISLRIEKTIQQQATQASVMSTSDRRAAVKHVHDLSPLPKADVSLVKRKKGRPTSHACDVTQQSLKTFTRKCTSWQTERNLQAEIEEINISSR